MRGYRAAARPAQTCFAASCRKHPPQVITASNVRQIYKSFSPKLCELNRRCESAYGPGCVKSRRRLIAIEQVIR